jgi:protein-S-isoprenylcysteine O-methyltransferase Ste14
MHGLLVRAWAAFLLLPGIVAFLVPLLIVGPERWAFASPWGAVPLLAGVVLLLACVREFYAIGRGTLAPWAPPTALVVTGAYRWSRNPIYLGVLLILAGWAVGYRSWPLTIYTVLVMAALHLRVVLHEEPRLTRTFGDAWNRYRERAPRWL